jgi:hypothetical protein
MESPFNRALSRFVVEKPHSTVTSSRVGKYLSDIVAASRSFCEIIPFQHWLNNDLDLHSPYMRSSLSLDIPLIDLQLPCNSSNIAFTDMMTNELDRECDVIDSSTLFDAALSSKSTRDIMVHLQLNTRKSKRLYVFIAWKIRLLRKLLSNFEKSMLYALIPTYKALLAIFYYYKKMETLEDFLVENSATFEGVMSIYKLGPNYFEGETFILYSLLLYISG